MKIIRFIALAVTAVALSLGVLAVCVAFLLIVSYVAYIIRGGHDE